MTVRIAKPSVNIREKLAELERPIGLNGQALMATETPQQAFDLLGAGRRNLIINGDMTINQRGIVGGSNNAGTSRSGGYGLDRWTAWRANDGLPAGIIQEQSTDVPTGQYFKNSLKLTMNGAGGNPTANSSVRLLLHQMIEGNNMYELRYGTSSAKYFTFSFFVKCSVTGTYAVTFTNDASNRGYVATYDINSASTWEYKTITVPGDTTGTWTTDSTAGLTINFDLGVNGPTTSTYNTWLSGDYRGGTTTTKLNAINGATYFITGVQLEAGKVATPFEYRSIGEELALCQRYYLQSGGAAAYSAIFGAFGTCITTTLATLYFPLPVSMRASPVLSYTGTPRLDNGQAGFNISALSGSIISTNLSTGVLSVTSSGLTLYQPVKIDANAGGSIVSFSAEL